MPVTVQIKPDLSAFREATINDIVSATGCDMLTAQSLLEHFWVVPR